MNHEISYKVVKRLAAAEGYLELELPQAALSELNRIGDAGPFNAIEQLLRGEALTGLSQFDEAIEPLKKAADLFPAPMNRRAWASLSKCYASTGQDSLANEALVASQTEVASQGQPGVIVQVVLPPIFTAVLGNQVRQIQR